MPLSIPQGYTLVGATTGSLGTTDGATYFIGSDFSTAGSLSYSQASIIVPKAGLVRALTGKVRIGTPGSGEAVAHYVRVNDAVDSAVTNAAYNANDVLISNFNLAVPVAQGDTLAVKIVAPTWVTNPAGVRFTFFVFIET